MEQQLSLGRRRSLEIDISRPWLRSLLVVVIYMSLGSHRPQNVHIYLEPTTSPLKSLGVVLEKFFTSSMTVLVESLPAAFLKSSMLPHSRVAWTAYGESSPNWMTFSFVSRCFRSRSCSGEIGVAYLPGLEAVGRPVLLDEGHVSLEVVVHVEVGSLLVEYYISYLALSQAAQWLSELLTGGSCAHVCGCEVIELCLLLARPHLERMYASPTLVVCVDVRCRCEDSQCPEKCEAVKYVVATGSNAQCPTSLVFTSSLEPKGSV
jgi:hypothetical protein